MLLFNALEVQLSAGLSTVLGHTLLLPVAEAGLGTHAVPVTGVAAMAGAALQVVTLPDTNGIVSCTVVLPLQKKK